MQSRQTFVFSATLDKKLKEKLKKKNFKTKNSNNKDSSEIIGNYELNQYIGSFFILKIWLFIQQIIEIYIYIYIYYTYI